MGRGEYYAQTNIWYKFTVLVVLYEVKTNLLVMLWLCSTMPRHTHKLTKAQDLSYKEAGLSVAKIVAKTGMSRSALSRLFTLAEKLPQSWLQTLPPRKVG